MEHYVLKETPARKGALLRRAQSCGAAGGRGEGGRKGMPRCDPGCRPPSSWSGAC